MGGDDPHSFVGSTLSEHASEEESAALELSVSSAENQANAASEAAHSVTASGHPVCFSRAEQEHRMTNQATGRGRSSSSLRIKMPAMASVHPTKVPVPFTPLRSALRRLSGGAKRRSEKTAAVLFISWPPPEAPRHPTPETPRRHRVARPGCHPRGRRSSRHSQARRLPCHSLTPHRSARSGRAA